MSDRIKKWGTIVSLIIAGLVFLFGSSIGGSVIADHFNQKLMKKCIDGNAESIERNKFQIGTQEKSVLIIQEKVDVIDGRTERMEKDLEFLKRYLMQR